MSRFMAVFCGVLLATWAVQSEHQLKRMPSSDRRMAAVMLSRCREYNDRLENETAVCAARTGRLARATRCRRLNTHLEMAEARLDRLEEFALLQWLESLRPTLAGCGEDAAAELRRLESERSHLQQTVAETARIVAEQERRQRAVVRETDMLREEEKVLDCETARLETERRLLERQLELQTAARDALSGQREAQRELAAALEAAGAERTRAAELCWRQTKQHRGRLDSCRRETDRLEALLEETPEQTAESLHALEEELKVCQAEVNSCAGTVSACAAEQEEASTRLIQREMAALAERGRLQGCQRELIAGRARFNQCRTSVDTVLGQIRALQQEARGSSDSVDRLDQCYSDVSLCGSRAATCTQRLAELRASEETCRVQTADWCARWQSCNTSAAGVESQRLQPLRLSAQQLEEAVNQTVARGRRCEEEGLRARADRGFAEEDLARAQAVLATTTQTLKECRGECGMVESEGEAEEAMVEPVVKAATNTGD